MTRRIDLTETVTQTLVGYAVASLLVLALRSLGLWDGPWWLMSVPFVLVSLGRGYAVRRAFRRWGR